MWELSRQVNESSDLTDAFNEGIAGLQNRLAMSADGEKFLSDLSLFVSEHGARGPYEWDAASETWEVKPESVLAAIDAMRHADETLSPANRHAAAVADREAAEAEVRAIFDGNEEAMGALELGLRTARVLVPGRERTKLTAMMTIHEIRLPI